MQQSRQIVYLPGVRNNSKKEGGHLTPQIPWESLRNSAEHSFRTISSENDRADEFTCQPYRVARWRLLGNGVHSCPRTDLLASDKAAFEGEPWDRDADASSWASTGAEGESLRNEAVMLLMICQWRSGKRAMLTSVHQNARYINLIWKHWETTKNVSRKIKTGDFLTVYGDHFLPAQMLKMFIAASS